MLMNAAELPPLKTEPLSEYRVYCEIEAHDRVHRVCLLVLATDEDDAGDQALFMLDHSRVADVAKVAKGGNG